MDTAKVNNSGFVSDKSLSWLARTVVALCGGVLLLRLVAFSLPEQRLWGINHLAYFSPYFILGITILGFMVFIPRMNRWLQTMLRKLLNSIYYLTIRRHKYLWFAILSLLSTIVFYLLRVKTPFLGDGAHLLTGLLIGEGSLSRETTSEPLEMALRLHLYKFLKQVVAADTRAIYASMSYLAGAIFVFFSALTADLLGKDKFEKVFVFFILIGMGSIVLFLGYAEHYSLNYASILAYLYFSLIYLKKRRSILPATLTFVVGCSLHLLMLCLFPSLVFLYLLKPDAETGEPKVSRRRMFLLSLLCIPVLVGMYAYLTEYSRHSVLGTVTVPLTAAARSTTDWLSMSYYTLFSPSHLLDLLNEHLLASPIGLILLLSVVTVFGLKKVGLRNRIVQFLAVVVVFQLTFHFLVDPKLGAVRDWDLFCFTTLGYTLLAIYLFLKLVQDNQQVRYLGMVLVFTSLFSTLPWVMINASSIKSLERVANAVKLDPARNFRFFLYMDEYLNKVGGLGEEVSIRFDELFREQFPLAWVDRRAREQVQAGNPDSAEAIYEEGVRIAPLRASTHYNLGAFYLQRGRHDQAILEFEEVIQVAPEDISAFQSYKQLGYIYLLKKQTDKAIEMYKRAIEGEIDNKENIYQNLGHCYLLQGKLDEAILAYQEALKSNPDFIEPHYHLGQVYRQKGIKWKAIKEFKTYVRYSTDEERIRKLKELISELSKE